MTAAEVPAERCALLLRAYAAYNDRNLDALSALLAEDVDWPGDDGGRLRGKDAVRAYWTEQWTRTRTFDRPSDPCELGDGRIAIRIDQTVRDLDGSIVAEGRYRHVVRIEGGLLSRLDIEPGP